MKRRHAKRVAKWWAGAILDAVVNDGFDPDILRQEYTAEERKVVHQELNLLAQWLLDNGDIT